MVEFPRAVTVSLVDTDFNEALRETTPAIHAAYWRMMTGHGFCLRGPVQSFDSGFNVRPFVEGRGLPDLFVVTVRDPKAPCAFQFLRELDELAHPKQPDRPDEEPGRVIEVDLNRILINLVVLPGDDVLGQLRDSGIGPRNIVFSSGLTDRLREFVVSKGWVGHHQLTPPRLY